GWIIVEQLPAADQRPGIFPDRTGAVKLIENRTSDRRCRHNLGRQRIVIQFSPTPRRPGRVGCPNGSGFVNLVKPGAAAHARRGYSDRKRIVIDHLPSRERWPRVSPDLSIAVQLKQPGAAKTRRNLDSRRIVV